MEKVSLLTARTPLAVSYSDLAAFSNLTDAREIASVCEAGFYLRSRILRTFDALADTGVLAFCNNNDL